MREIFTEDKPVDSNQSSTPKLFSINYKTLTNLQPLTLQNKK